VITTSMDEELEMLRKRVLELSKDPNPDPSKVYDLVEQFFTVLAQKLGLRVVKDASKRGVWTVELLDRAVDDIVDALGGKYEVLELWEEAWELRLEKDREKALSILRKLSRVLEDLSTTSIRRRKRKR